MPDDVSPSADPRSIDDVLTQMFAREQQQMPFFQQNPTGDQDPSRLPRGFTPAEMYYRIRGQGLDPAASKRVLQQRILHTNKFFPDLAEQENLPDVTTPEQYEQYMAQVPGS